jgi:hypothetical protein
MQDRTIGRFVFATLLMTLGTASPVAAVDLSGDYVVTVEYHCWARQWDENDLDEDKQ